MPPKFSETLQEKKEGLVQRSIEKETGVALERKRLDARVDKYIQLYGQTHCEVVSGRIIETDADRQQRVRTLHNTAKRKVDDVLNQT